jgi:hypothetical protein
VSGDGGAGGLGAGAGWRPAHQPAGGLEHHDHRRWWRAHHDEGAGVQHHDSQELDDDPGDVDDSPVGFGLAKDHHIPVAVVDRPPVHVDNPLGRRRR